MYCHIRIIVCQERVFFVSGYVRCAHKAVVSIPKVKRPAVVED